MLALLTTKNSIMGTENSMAGLPKLTKGEYRVGIHFNVGGDSISANLIDEIEKVAANSDNGEVKRLCALAQTEIEAGAMWAVKAATKPAQE